MSNKNLNLVKKLGTLLVVGLILVSHSPVTALAADDITLPENPTPTVESVVISNDQTPITEPTPEVQVIEVTTEPAANVDTPVVETAPSEVTVEVTPEVTAEVATDTVVEIPVVEAPAPEAKMAEVAPVMASLPVDNSFAISEEIGGNSLPVSTNNNPLVVSPEIGGQTGTNNTDNGQGTFTTLPGNNGTTTTSSEGHFTTSTGGGCTSSCGGGSTQTSSDQGSFTTLSNGTSSPASAEGSFTTQSNGGGGGGGGCSSNCGGGSSGGGYSLGGGSSSSGPALPLPCELYLKKFIRLGYANDPFEVTKLEIFLNTFEGFNLPVNGIYEQRDFDAVSIFQKRYFGAVLTPWGITDSTGYVYITTTLTINQIYCQHTVGNDLDLSHIYPVYGGVNNGVPTVTGIEATTTPTTTPSVKDLPNLLQAAAVGALNFIKDWWCLIIIILLILIIAYLLDERERLARKLKESKAALNDVTHGATPIAMLLPKEGEEEWIALAKTEPDVDPGQEPLTKL